MDRYTVYYETVGSRGFLIAGAVPGNAGPIEGLSYQGIVADSTESAMKLMRERLMWQDGWPADEEPYASWLDYPSEP